MIKDMTDFQTCRSGQQSFVFVWLSHPPMSPVPTQTNTLCPLEANAFLNKFAGLYKYVSHFGGHHALNEFQVEFFDVSSVFTKKTQTSFRQFRNIGLRH